MTPLSAVYAAWDMWYVTLKQCHIKCSEWAILCQRYKLCQPWRPRMYIHQTIGYTSGCWFICFFSCRLDNSVHGHCNLGGRHSHTILPCPSVRFGDELLSFLTSLQCLLINKKQDNCCDYRNAEFPWIRVWHLRRCSLRHHQRVGFPQIVVLNR